MTRTTLLSLADALDAAAALIFRHEVSHPSAPLDSDHIDAARTSRLQAASLRAIAGSLTDEQR